MPESGNGAEVSKYEYVGVTQNPTQMPGTSRPQLHPKLWKIFAPSDGTYPKAQISYDQTWRVKEYRDAVAIKPPQGRAPWKFFVTGTNRGEREDPLSTTGDPNLYTVYYDSRGRAIQLADEMFRIVNQQFDNKDRVIERTFPEGNKTQFEYDDVTQQITKITQKPKGSTFFSTPPADIVIQATYDPTCGRIKTVTDARSKITTWNYLSTRCTLTNVQQPQVPNPENANVMTIPTTSFLYNTLGQLTHITDPTGRLVTFDYDTNKYRWHRRVNPATLNLTTTYGHNAYGDINSVTDPRGNATTYTYDKQRRLTRIDAPMWATTINRLDLDGDVYQVEKAMDSVPSQWQIWSKTFTPTKQTLTETSPTNEVTTYSYDGLDRVDVVTDPDGRKVKTEYFKDSKTKRVIKAYQSPSMTPINFVTYTLTPNGQIDTVMDANGNVTNLNYDGHDRLARTFFPDPASGLPCSPALPHSTAAPTCTANQKYEELGYDPNSNVTSKRNRSAKTISFAFDDLNRETTRTVPTNTLNHFARTLTSTYDLASRKWNLTADSQTISHRYDAAGRLDYVTDSALGATNMIDYGYDAADNRTSLAWPGGGSLTYTFDALNRIDTITDNASVQLADYEWDTLSRRSFVYYNGAGLNLWAAVAYEADDDVASLMHFGPANALVTLVRNHSGQIVSIAANDTVLGRPAAIRTDTFTPNKLNQITSVNSTSLTYDLNGNLTTDGTFTYEYDEENRLRSAVGAGTTATYEYDPLGRRRSKTVNGTVTKYVSDGAEEIEERNAANTVLRKYAYGSSIDERIAIYDSALCAGGGRCYYFTNWQGSTIGLVNQDNTLNARYHFGPYGEGTNWTPSDALTGNPFRYTGRRVDPETGLYYYRARYYSPNLGRFLQTDPIGTKDDFNLYAYVKNDPLNKTDPTGTQEFYGDIALEANLRGGESATNLAQSMASGMAKGAALSALIEFAPAATARAITTGTVVGAAVGGGTAAVTGEPVVKGTVNGAVSGAATSVASAAAPSRVTKALAVGAAAGAATYTTGGDAFDTGIAAVVSGAVEYATGNDRVANAAALGAKDLLGDVAKSAVKKVVGNAAKEGGKAACKSANADKKC